MNTHQAAAQPERRFRKTELLKLVSARSDFSGARRAAALLVGSASALGDDLNYPLLVATVVCYSRPFTANEPHGAIPNRYSRGVPKVLQPVHAELLDARHKCFAHSDLTDRPAYVYPPGCEIAEGVTAAGLGSAIETPRYSAGFVTSVGQLCEHLLGELSRDIAALLNELYGGRQLPLDRIRIAIDNEL